MLWQRSHPGSQGFGLAPYFQIYMYTLYIYIRVHFEQFSSFIYCMMVSTALLIKQEDAHAKFASEARRHVQNAMPSSFGVWHCCLMGCSTTNSCTSTSNDLGLRKIFKSLFLCHQPIITVYNLVCAGGKLQ